LFIVEDLHWVDATTLELLTMLVEQGQGNRQLTILTARPEFVPP
jgi:predicted ATPase